jgi:hypothetical protein
MSLYNGPPRPGAQLPLALGSLGLAALVPLLSQSSACCSSAAAVPAAHSLFNFFLQVQEEGEGSSAGITSRQTRTGSSTWDTLSRLPQGAGRRVRCAGTDNSSSC